MNLIQSIFSNVWSLAFAIFLLGFTIFIHELGHFLAAKKRGMKIDRFSIGFGPKILAWKGKDGVEYRLSWILLGGYVALPQLAEMEAIEGESKIDAEKLPPISFSTKVIVSAAGPLFNCIFAFVLATILCAIGQKIPSGAQGPVVGNIQTTIETSDGNVVQSPALLAGIKAGDTILAVDGKEVSTFDEINARIIRGSGRDEKSMPKVTLTIKRGDTVRDVDVFPVYITRERIREIGISFAAQIEIAKVMTGSPSETAGLRVGDIVTHIDGNPILAPGIISEHIAITKEKPVTISYIRDNKQSEAVILPKKEKSPNSSESAYRIGIAPWYVMTKIHIAPWTQVSNVLGDTWENIKTLVDPRSDIGLDKMSGPVGIVTMLSATAKRSMTTVVLLMILINIGLAVFNLLPIPVLDGGHILFAMIAKIRGRPLPANIIMTTQSVFMLLLLSMMVYVTFFDVRRNLPQSKSPPAAQQQAPAEPATEAPSK
ncbi:regulator of sigma E protease [Ereboglobus sp. PH5-5]|uniref:RIP metalloprotease RseP n=1 Tax=Ereboglobus sp. PH5-5 TaxID=2940529 RepID=UPI002406EFCA|nr:RIP metalloprotease RseP [Ereboglobus sp. PH5-5]MDF9834252.1 regulator of sigma E protease [Ereboglobus sp. PH5-5]